MKEKFSIYIIMDVMKRFKVRCVEEGVSMSEKVQELIKEWLER